MTQNVPMIPGFATNDVLEQKWPLFCRDGFINNIELAWSEYLAVWGIEPVRIFI